MSFVDFESSSGPLRMHYNIATPTNPSADAIDETLPTVLFLHAIYLGQQIFERMCIPQPQYSPYYLAYRLNLLTASLSSRSQ